MAAAFDLLQLRGIRALTLDGVACHAQLSKGAVLYHFSSKDGLISAMLQEAARGCMETPTKEAWRSFVRALMAAECMSPQALEDIVSLFAELSHRVMDGNGQVFSAEEAMAAAIGTAFLNELGLSTTDRRRE